MKILKIILIGFFVLILLAVVAAVIFIKTFDPNRYKPQIISAANSALGREFNFDRLELKLSLKDGAQVKVNKLSISEDPAFGSENFLSVDEAFLGIDVLALVTTQKVNISSVTIDNPHVTVIRQKGGALNVMTIGKPQTPVAAAPPSEMPASEASASAQVVASQQSSGQPAAMPVVNVDSLKIKNAEIKFIDRTTDKEIVLPINIFDLMLSHFSLKSPFDFSLQAGILSEQTNLQLKGRAQFDVDVSEISLNNTQVNVDFDRLNLLDLKSLPELSAVPLPEELKGQLIVNLKEFQAGPKGLGDVLVDAELANGKVVAKNLLPGVPLEVDRMNLKATNAGLGGVPFNVAFQMAYLDAKPNVVVNGMVSYDMKTQNASVQNLKVDLDLTNFSIKDLRVKHPMLAATPMPEEFKGKISTTIKELKATAKGLETLVADVQLLDGRINFPNAAPGISFVAQDINATVKDFSLGNKLFAFTLKATYVNPTPNIDVNGQAKFDIATQAFGLENTNVVADLSQFSLDEIKKQVTLLEKTPLPQVLKGNLVLKIKELTASPKGLGVVKLDVDLKNGVVSMKDVAPGISLDLNAIDLLVSNFTLDQKPFTFEASLGYLSDAANINSKGQASFNLNTQSLQLTKTNVNTDLSTFSYEELKKTVTLLAKTPLPEYTKGKLSVMIDEATVSPKGLVSLSTSGEVIDGVVKVKEMAKPAESIQTKFKATQSDLTVDSLSLKLGAGTVQGKLTVLDYLKAQQLDMAADVTNIQLADLVDQTKLPVKFEGILQGNLKMKGQVSNVASLVGDGKFTLKDTVLKEFDLLGFVLLPVQNIPVVGSLVSLVAFPILDASIKQINTTIDTAETAFQLQNGVVHVAPLSAQSNDFKVDGEGDVYLNNNFTFGDATNLPIKFFVPKDSVERLLGRLKSLEPALIPMKDEQGNLNFTLVVKAKDGKLYPAMADVLMKGIENKGKELLKDLLGDALKKQGISTGQPQEQQTTPDGTQAEPQSQGQEQPQSLEGEIVDTIFGTIFKNK